MRTGERLRAIERQLVAARAADAWPVLTDGKLLRAAARMAECIDRGGVPLLPPEALRRLHDAAAEAVTRAVLADPEAPRGGQAFERRVLELMRPYAPLVAGTRPHVTDADACTEGARNA